jgi:hypothetical protein
MSRGIEGIGLSCAENIESKVDGSCRRTASNERARLLQGPAGCALRKELDVDVNNGLSFSVDSLVQRQWARVNGAAVDVERKMVAKQSSSGMGNDLCIIVAGGDRFGEWEGVWG